MKISPNHFKYLLSLSLLISLLACKSENTKDYTAYNHEIAGLETREDKEIYLTNVYTKFIDHTKQSDVVMDLFGLNSDEHLEIKKSYLETVKESEAKVQAYLNTFGYPSLMKLGRKAAFAPWVITFKSNDINYKKSNYKFLYDAYVFGDIDDELFLVYLQDLHLRLEKKDYYSPDTETIIESIENIMQILNTSSW